jgi:predicted  nucleic acid-binding Zn-ribbon protein
MDQELIAYLDTRFRETNQQIAGLREELVGFREETSQRFERVETEVREAHVKIEDLQGQIRLLAEGVMSSEEKLQAFRTEVKQEFDDTRSLMRSAYAQVDRRVHSLEDWRESKERDPLELIRERYGKTKASG